MQITKTVMMYVIGRGLNPRPPKQQSGFLYPQGSELRHITVFFCWYTPVCADPSGRAV